LGIGERRREEGAKKQDKNLTNEKQYGGY